MNNNDFLEIGYISKLHGYRGELKIKPSSVVLIQAQDIKHIMLSLKGGITPYKIEQISTGGDTYIIKLLGVDNDVAAKALIGSTCSVAKQHVQINKAEAMANELVGYIVIDTQKGTVGKVKELDTKAPQALLYIVNEEGVEFILPYVMDAIITSIDKEAKQILVDAPIGLLDLYLE
jgi:16S rRNA processing protein RimM